MVHLGFTSWKHFVIENKFQVSHFTQMRNCRSRTLSALGGHAVAASLAAAVFPSVWWDFAESWPSADWQPFDLWSGTGCSGGGHWSLPSSAADTRLQQQQLACRVQWCVKWSVLLSCCGILGFSARDLLCTLWLSNPKHAGSVPQMLQSSAAWESAAVCCRDCCNCNLSTPISKQILFEIIKASWWMAAQYY